MKKLNLLILIIFLTSLSLVSQVQRPEDLKFPPLKYEPPDPRIYRTSFTNGLRGYVIKDSSIPLFEIAALIHYGNLYNQNDKAGIGRILERILIKGGTKRMEGSKIEERIDFMGGNLTFNVGERTSTLSLSVLSKDMDEGLSIFFDILMNPEFREESLELAKTEIIDELKQANDSPSVILAREFERLLYGDHPITYRPNRKTIEGITAGDLKALHSKYFYPKNIILAISGDFDKNVLKSKINRIVSKWKNKEINFPQIHKKFPEVEPGVYFIQKKINQGYINIGHLGIENTNPDYYAVQVMNFILGGGSFTSRITSKVRSDEGLAYNTGSRFTYRWGFPGIFSGYVQTKSSTVGYAIYLILKEFERIRNEYVTDDELKTAIDYYIESFSDNFSSPMRTMLSFAQLEMQGEPFDYYMKYPQMIKMVTKEKVLEVAKKYIKPEKIAIMIVGDFEPCNKGSEKFEGPLEKFGKIHFIKLRDPLTGEEIKD
ncbi:MAG: M16 family metallopeptidase [Candidatus Aminicenantia bacterium]